MSAPPVGLYSIGVRRLDAGAFIALAAAQQVPFAHLRGGPRGYDLANAGAQAVTAWARQAREAGIPVTLVTCDTDLADFTVPGTGPYRKAARDLAATAAAAAEFGAPSVRLLARSVPPARDWDTLQVPAAGPGMTVLAELHHPGLFAPPAAARLESLLDRTPGLALLLDSAQVDDAWQAGPQAARTPLPALLTRLTARSPVVHLSDRGDGLARHGHRLLAATARAAARTPEAAFEWTGTDRTPQACLARYRTATAWWAARWEEHP